jgi:hypothetical protein
MAHPWPFVAKVCKSAACENTDTWLCRTESGYGQASRLLDLLILRLMNTLNGLESFYALREHQRTRVLLTSRPPMVCIAEQASIKHRPPRRISTLIGRLRTNIITHSMQKPMPVAVLPHQWLADLSVRALFTSCSMPSKRGRGGTVLVEGSRPQRSCKAAELDPYVRGSDRVNAAEWRYGTI